MITYGLIGYPLLHSGSQLYFTDKFRNEKITGVQYSLFPLMELKSLTALLQHHPDLYGLNVTIPYKKEIIPYLDWLDPVSKKIGAVNTIKILRNRNTLFLEGYNTDAAGFHNSFHPETHQNALILGTGGASKAVAFALGEWGIKTLFVSGRKTGPDIVTYSGLSKQIFQEYTLIINTTPLGMFPDTSSYPLIPYDFITRDHFLYDLVYNPVQTEFLKKGKARGAKVQNGIRMLHNQAELSYKIWETRVAGSFKKKEEK